MLFFVFKETLQKQESSINDAVKKSERKTWGKMNIKTDNTGGIL